MHSCSDYKVEYWVKDKEDALLGRFNEDAFNIARQTAIEASGRVYEVHLDITFEGMYIMSETEV
jgi:hypothetical protein